ncbi:MAG: type III pantothenate kinase [Erysipelotrichales bacterium]|nr:type III pantothenate kinase [Erysipelotrichales bacterium]
MFLTLDLGNTNLFIGVCDDEKVIKTFRTSTDLNKSGDEYALVLDSLLKDYKENIEGVIISSVVPSLNHVLKQAVRHLYGVEPILVEAGIKTGLPIRIDNPNELGADLVCDGVGAIAKYGPKTIIVDLGTATKILVIDDKGAFVGGIIAAGLKISMEALAGKAAKLSEISLEYPKSVICKNTTDCMNAGIVTGTKFMIQSLVSEMEKELGYNTNKIATGGFSHIINDLEGFEYDFNLILDGLRVIYLKNKHE